MEPREEQQAATSTEQQGQGKRRRFHLVRLEERVAPGKRFRMEKLEERITPSNGGGSHGDNHGGSTIGGY
jgi:hypothetical protein